jgi:hypothetical protein
MTLPPPPAQQDRRPAPSSRVGDPRLAGSSPLHCEVLLRNTCTLLPSLRSTSGAVQSSPSTWSALPLTNPVAFPVPRCGTFLRETGTGKG